jgi:GNAT superfamily N-acetyltransferase
MTHGNDQEEIRLRHDLRPGDLGRLLSQHGVLYAEECGWDITFEGYVAGTLSHFASALDPHRERIWLAEIGEWLVGSIAIIKHSEEVAQLRWLLLDPQVRGRGLGRRLMHEALAFTRAASYRMVFLETVKSLNAAAALYRSVGFKLVEEKQLKLWGCDVTDQRYELNLE